MNLTTVGAGVDGIQRLPERFSGCQSVEEMERGEIAEEADVGASKEADVSQFTNRLAG